MAAYYNEIDSYAAQWLRNLISAGHIAPGDVDERDIRDVKPDDLRSYTQCHFFAGIGVWSYALRRAGWPDDRPVWTGSCPCQPFSVAGAARGFDDERHLWPAFHFLISERRPAIIFGEQVASKDANPWIDLVHTDMEALGYAFGAVPFPSAGVGAPHIRDRLYWVGHANNTGLEGHAGHGCAARRGGTAGSVAEAGVFGGMGNSEGYRSEMRRDVHGEVSGNGFTEGCHTGGLAYTSDSAGQRSESRPIERGLSTCIVEDATVRPSPTNGHWRDADWLLCRDGKWRPVEPGTFPLAHGAPARVGRLRAYGNAINASQAQIFIEAVMEVAP